MRILRTAITAGMAIVLLASFMVAQPQTTRGQEEKTITVTGTLTNEGVECPALRAEDRTLYTLAGDLKGFKVGDKVKVSGTIAEISTCQQGITINIKSIEKAK